MTLPRCPEVEQLLAYTLGKLPDETSDEIAAHLDTCSNCESTVSTLDQASDELLAGLRSPVAADQVAQQPVYQHAAARVKALAGVGAGAGGGLPVEPSDDSIPLGTLGEYELLERLGQGGMGTVFKAHHTNLKRIMAVKILLKSRVKDKKARARFDQERAAAGNLNHPNIVLAHDAREIDGHPILGMEYVDGIDLSKLVKRCGQLPVPDACELIRQTALGLQYAHENRLVHRDVKPSNLMLAVSGELRAEGGELRICSGNQITLPPGGSDAVAAGEGPLSATVKILDLGLALLKRDQPNGEDVTETGQAMGTADYIAPEQTIDSHDVDHRADIYSLGCTLYKLLAGQPPFGGPKYKTTPAKMIAHSQAPVPPITNHRDDVPAELVTLLDRMLAKQPGDRPATAVEVAEALAPFAAGSDLPALLTRATSGPASDTVDLAGTISTCPSLSAPQSDTAPSVAPPATGSVFGVPTRAVDQPPKPAPKLASWRSWPPLVRIAIGLGALGAFVLLGVIVIRIFDKEGRQIGSLEVENAGAVAVERDGRTVSELDLSKGKREPSPPELRPKVTPIKIGPEPLDIEKGEPLSPWALVSRPTKLKGVKSWTIETREHRANIVGVSVGPNGKLIASCDGSLAAIRLHNAHTGQLLRILMAEDAAHVCWSPDGHIIASFGMDGNVRFWEVATGRLIRTSRARTEDTGPWSQWNSLALYKGLSMDWSSDGKALAISHQDWNAPQVWHQESGWVPRVLKELTPRSFTGTVRWSPDGTLLAYAGGDVVRRWSPRKDTYYPDLKHTDSSLVAWSRDGKLLKSFSPTDMRVWDHDSGQRVGELSSPSPHYLSPDGELMLTTDTTGFKLVNAHSGELVRRYGNLQLTHPWCHSWPPDNRWFIVGGPSLDIWSTDTSQIVRSVSGCGAEFAAEAACWSPNGETLAIQVPRSADFVRLFDARFGEWVRTIRCDGPIAWSPDGEIIAARDPKGVCLRDVETGSKTRILEGIRDIEAIVWAPDGTRLAAGGSKDVLIWDTNSGQPVHSLESPVTCMAWSPDSRVLAGSVGGAKGGIRLWDSESGEQLHFLPAITQVDAIVWSPDSGTLALGGYRGHIPLWDASSGQHIITLKFSPSDTVKELRWSENGKTLVSHGSDFTVRHWDFATGQLLSSTPGTQPGSFSPDGRRTIYPPPNGRWFRGDDETPVEIWDIEAGESCGKIVFLRDNKWLTVSPEGHYRGSPFVERMLVYVALTDDGEQITYTPEQFKEEYGWENDTSKVRLIDDGEDQDVAEADSAGSAKPEHPDAIARVDGVKPTDQPQETVHEATPPVGKPITVGPPIKLPKVEPLNLDPEPLDIQPGDPMAQWAFIPRPAKLPGVKSWTIETEGHRGVPVVRYSPDSRWLASADWEGTLRIWDARTGEVERILVGAGTNVFWLPQGSLLASWGGGKPCRIWNAETGQLITTLPDALSRPAAWSPDGKMVAVHENHSTLAIWNIESNQRVVDVESNFSHGVGWHPEGRIVAFVSGRNDIKLWNWETQETVRMIPKALNDRCPRLLWSPDGELLVGAANDLRIWQAATGELLARLGLALPSRPPEAWPVAWSPDGQFLMYAGGRQGIHFYDVQLAEVVRRWPKASSDIFDLRSSPDGQRVAAGTAHGRLLVHDNTTGAILTDVANPRACIYESRGGYRGSFSPDNRNFVAAVGADHKVRVWDTISGKCTRTLQCNAFHTGTSADWSVDGQYVAVRSGAIPGLAVIDVASNKVVTDGNLGVHLFSRSSHGKILARVQDEGIVLWDSEAGKQIMGLESSEGLFSNAMAFSRDGAILAAADSRGNVILWGVASGKKKRTCPIYESAVKSLAWLPDGKTLACGCTDGIRLWNTEPGNPIKTIPGPSPTVFSRDGRLCSAQSYNTARIWDTLTGEAQMTFVGLRDDNWMAIHPSGHYRGTPGVKYMIRYVALTDDGQQITYTSEQFKKEHGWENDPEKVQTTK